MSKIWMIFGVISMVILGIILFFKFAEKHGVQTETIKQQEQQIEIKNEVIETKTYQQKIISKTSVNVDFAARSQWMQLIFEERASENN